MDVDIIFQPESKGKVARANFLRGIMIPFACFIFYPIIFKLQRADEGCTEKYGAALGTFPFKYKDSFYANNDTHGRILPHTAEFQRPASNQYMLYSSIYDIKHSFLQLTN